MLAIEVKNVWKKYKIGQPKKLSEIIPSFFSINKQKEFWALKNINLNIKKGETFGIIGPNGSGKSTLLKILIGITSPTRGKVYCQGRISSLLELGTGFHPDLTGRENVYLNGSILGLTRKRIDEKFKDIVEFAQLRKFIDVPVKHYSSGMQVRLGFAVAINMDPDILVIDEALAVGDADFQNKSFSAIQDFKKRGISIILATHDMNIVQTLCNKTIFIKDGKIIDQGKSSKVISKYLGTVIKSDKKSKAEGGKRFGDGKARITKIWLEDANSHVTNTISTSHFLINVKVKFLTDSAEPVPGVIIRNRIGMQVTASNTTWRRIKTGKFKKGEERLFTFKFPNIFEVGYYTVSANVVYEDLRRIYDWRNDVFEFFCNKPYKTGGIVNPSYDIVIN